jgi:hypothetical protein
VSTLVREGRPYIQLGISSQPVLMLKKDYDDCFYTSKTGKDLCLKLLDRVFSKAELSSSNLRGGTVHSKDKVVLKSRLDPLRMSAITSQVNLEHPGFMASPSDETLIRNAINNKCRHTKLPDV